MKKPLKKLALKKKSILTLTEQKKVFGGYNISGCCVQGCGGIPTRPSDITLCAY